MSVLFRPHTTSDALRPNGMMHSHLPSLRPLAVPSIGFAQNIAVGPEMLGRPAFEHPSDNLCDASMRLADRIVWLPVTQRDRS